MNGYKEENGLEIELLPLDVGTGISQVIPVVVSALDGKDRVVSIEQPELHLHPRMQARLADLFIEAVKDKDINNWFLLETHSEHLILRLQRRIRETTEKETSRDINLLKSSEVAIYHIGKKEDKIAVKKIRLDIYGDLIDPWPDDFFEIDFNERFGNA